MAWKLRREAHSSAWNSAVKRYLPLLQRLVDALAHANTGNQREFEALLEESEKRRTIQQRTTARHVGAATRRSRRRPAAVPLLPLQGIASH